jgi:hypothetical protein
MNVPRQFARIPDSVDVQRLQRSTVGIIGLGSVGSQLALQLAQVGVGNFVLVDGKALKIEHTSRHLCGAGYVGRNKAEATAEALSQSIVGLFGKRLRVFPHNITRTKPGTRFVLGLLARCDLIVASTDSRDAQRRINRSALRLDVPAIFPGIDADADRAEIFISLGEGASACFECWDGFRTPDAALRAIGALNTDVLALVHPTARLCIGLLGASTEAAEALRGTVRDPRPRTLHMIRRFDGPREGVFRGGQTYVRLTPDPRPGCPACGGQAPGAPTGRAAARSRAASSRVSTPPQPAPPARRLSDFALPSIEIPHPLNIPWAGIAVSVCVLLIFVSPPFLALLWLCLAAAISYLAGF